MIHSYKFRGSSKNDFKRLLSSIEEPREAASGWYVYSHTLYMSRSHDCHMIGPPETMREHIVAGANAMKSGNWKKCRDYILDIKVY